VSGDGTPAEARRRCPSAMASRRDTHPSTTRGDGPCPE
jgi:hypothetical protein